MPSLLPDRIETLRLALRRPAEADADPIFRSYAQDAAVCRYMAWRPHVDLMATREFLRACMASWDAGTARCYVLCERDADRPIGMFDVRRLGTAVELGYVLARPYWGEGRIPEALCTVTALALALPAILRVQATCDVEHSASQRALEKAGFVREGRMERHLVRPNLSSEPRASFLYATWR